MAVALKTRPGRRAKPTPQRDDDQPYTGWLNPAAEPDPDVEIEPEPESEPERKPKQRKAPASHEMSDPHGTLVEFRWWLVGLTPLITHAWSEKARREMLSKQVKAVKVGREAREPQEDFVNSLYEMGKGEYGFPAMGLKNSILSSAHKDRGMPRTDARSALWLQAEFVSTRPALAGAICDMPLLRIYGSQPEMREDMVRIGTGMNKTATLAYRGQFRTWAIRMTGTCTTSIMPIESLAFLVRQSGLSIGLGEWRNERSGVFGAYELATPDEAKRWDDFAAGTGPLPTRDNTVSV